MTEKKTLANSFAHSLEANEGLREAFLRLISPRNAAIQAEIETLRGQIEGLAALQAELERLENQIKQGDMQLSSRFNELMSAHQQAQAQQEALAAHVSSSGQSLQQEIEIQDLKLQGELAALKANLADPEAVDQRVSPVLISMLSKAAGSQQARFAQAIAPVIGPAIRHQIRDARQDIIDSLYPLIGQIIAKAIAESFRELNRNIDARMRTQFNVRSIASRLRASLTGVSAAELLMRNSLPFSIQYVILIHRETGLLLAHRSSPGQKSQELDLTSGMLTAIRDFVRDSFGNPESELEEITHGDRRILLESGYYAYLAIVLEGVEPTGYNELMNRVIHTINLEAETALRGFNGDMNQLPDFSNDLDPLLAPDPELLYRAAQPPPLSKGQKQLALASVVGLLGLIVLLSLACIYTVRLWPFVFPSP